MIYILFHIYFSFLLPPLLTFSLPPYSLISFCFLPSFLACTSASFSLLYVPFFFSFSFPCRFALKSLSSLFLLILLSSSVATKPLNTLSFPFQQGHNYSDKPVLQPSLKGPLKSCLRPEQTIVYV